MSTKNMTIIGIVVLVLCICIILIIRDKKDNSMSYRLTWFELQVAPMEYRFAIIPKQPILVGSIGENKATILLRHEVDPKSYDKTVESIDKLIKELGIMQLQQVNSENCFNDKTLEKESIHLRFMYSDNSSWSSYYEVNNVPQQVMEIIDQSKKIGLTLLNRETNKIVDTKDIDKLIDPENNKYDLTKEGVVLKIYINENAEIVLDGTKSSINQLGNQLDLLKSKNGVVWYSRYDPQKEPEDDVTKIVKEVLDEITKRNLPIKLNEENY